MSKRSFFPYLARSFVILIMAVLTSVASAQSPRPGSSTRSSSTSANRSSTSARPGNTTGGGASRAGGARQYRSNTELGEATITIDPETRSLVIVTDEDTHRELTKVIKTLDQIKPQVLIKVVFAEVTYNKGSDIGLEGSYTFNMKNPLLGSSGTATTVSTQTGPGPNGSMINTTTTTAGQAVGAAGSLGSSVALGSVLGLASATDGTFARVVTDDWQATLRALATRGNVEVLSRPSIMARNNQEAVIVVGQEVPFITNSRTDALGQINNTITYDNVGIILRVTPFITSEGTVEMIVAPEISTLNTTQTVPISSTVSAPTIDKRSAETVVVTPNGQTVVIGGLMETKRVESIRKVPLLGDIPLLGAAFRRTIKDNVKRELLIFLTPYIVNTPEGLQQLANKELDKTELMDQAFSPKEFEKYLDMPAPMLPETESSGPKEVNPPRRAIRIR